MRLVKPILGEEEAAAVKTVLRAVVAKRLLVDADELKVRHALEALDAAPVVDGSKAEKDPAAQQTGPFVRRSETSRRAMLRNYPRQGSQRERILMFLNGQFGATREALASHLSLPENSVRPRVRELIDGEWVEPMRDADGEVVTAPTHLGNASEVLVVTAKARAYFARRPAQVPA